MIRLDYDHRHGIAEMDTLNPDKILAVCDYGYGRHIFLSRDTRFVVTNSYNSLRSQMYGTIDLMKLDFLSADKHPLCLVANRIYGVNRAKTFGKDNAIVFVGKSESFLVAETPEEVMGKFNGLAR